MKNIAICGSKRGNPFSDYNFIETFEMKDVPIFCGLLHTKEIHFDRNASENQFKVLVRKRAFSCNYRDKSIILQISTQAPKDAFFVVGSDFIGEVVETGSEVTKFKIGDRVIANNAYPESGAPDVRPGIPSNHGSKEYQVFHEAKLLKVPEAMPDEVAAAFSIGGQTSYSIIRKFNPAPGSHILVTAAKSNTSLFVINALKKYDVNIYATTTSMLGEQELKSMGVKQVILIESQPESLRENHSLNKIVAETGGFNCVFDPFYDLHLGQIVEQMANGGKYITCGLYDQYSSLIGEKFKPFSLDARKLMNTVMNNNLQIIGNCLGGTEDLQNALSDYASGQLKVVIDSVFTNKQVGAFFDRTYNARDRFGKVVYKYN